MLLAALRAMAVQRSEQRPGDFECDAAAQAAAVDWGHEGFLFGELIVVWDDVASLIWVKPA